VERFQGVVGGLSQIHASSCIIQVCAKIDRGDGRFQLFRLTRSTGGVSVGSHPWIAAGAEPDTHQFNVTICL
jgi:hypothetical protein